MKRSDGRAKTVDAYIAAAPAKAQPMLRQLRRTVRAAAPRATEKISYRIPYYGYKGRLIYFAAFANHLSVYVMGAARKKYAVELKPYAKTQATMQFAYDKKIPTGLIRKLVAFRVKENDRQAESLKYGP